MLKYLKQLISILLMILSLSASSLLLPTPVAAQGTVPWSGVCVEKETITNVEIAGAQPEEVQVATIQGIQCIIVNIFSIAISALGLAGFVMFIIGSFKYLLSGGNSKGIESAKTTFTFAVVGLVVALSSIIILNVIAAFTGVDTILKFVIPNSDCGLNAQC